MHFTDVYIALLLLICLPSPSVQGDTAVLDDLSQFYLDWKYRHDNSDTLESSDLASIHNHSKIYENCQAFIVEFAKQASHFIQCSIDNARPFRFCSGCVVHYEKAKTVYNDINLNDEKKNNCQKKLLNSDRVQVINSVYADFEGIWNSADCNNCFVSDSITEDINGTVKFSLRQTTIDFIELYHNFTECIPRNISNVTGTVTICKDCATYYDKMNSMFDKLLNDKTSPQHVCMDIVDMMNYTRLLWGETLNCTRFHTEYASVMSLAVVLLLIPPTFYIVMKVYGTKKEKEIISQKRLSIYNQDNSFNYTVSSNPDPDNRHQNSVHHSTSSTEGPMRKRTSPT